MIGSWVATVTPTTTTSRPSYVPPGIRRWIKPDDLPPHRLAKPYQNGFTTMSGSTSTGDKAVIINATTQCPILNDFPDTRQAHHEIELVRGPPVEFRPDDDGHLTLGTYDAALLVGLYAAGITYDTTRVAKVSPTGRHPLTVQCLA